MRSRLSLLQLGLVLLACALVATPATPQQTRVIENDDWCDRHGYGDDDHERYCEVREITLSGGRDVITVDGQANGGISVEGWDRNEILVRAKVQASAERLSEARALVEDVTISTDRTISADGPRSGSRHEWWSVSYELFVPRESNLDLETVNGGIRIEGVSGDMEFHATNGGVTLKGLSGDVNGSTTNGGVKIELTGDRWESLLYTLSNLAIERLRPPGEDSMALTSGMFVTAVVVTLPMAIAIGQFHPLWETGIALREGAMFMHAAILALCFFGLYELFRLSDATYGSQVSYLTTISGVVFGIVLLGERPSLWVWAAVACILAGIALVGRAPTRG